MRKFSTSNGHGAQQEEPICWRPEVSESERRKLREREGVRLTLMRVGYKVGGPGCRGRAGVEADCGRDWDRILMLNVRMLELVEISVGLGIDMTVSKFAIFASERASGVTLPWLDCAKTELAGQSRERIK